MKICPKCRGLYSDQDELCSNCKIELQDRDTFITNDEFVIQQNNLDKKDNIIAFLLFAVIIVAVIGFFVWLISPSPNPTYTCSRCGETFTDSDNKLSISYSGYCEKCHEDVEFLFGVMEELEELQAQE